MISKINIDLILQKGSVYSYIIPIIFTSVNRQNTSVYLLMSELQSRLLSPMYNYTYYQVCTNSSNTTSATCWADSAFSFQMPWDHSQFWFGSCWSVLSLIFCFLCTIKGRWSYFLLPVVLSVYLISSVSLLWSSCTKSYNLKVCHNWSLIYFFR